MDVRLYQAALMGNVDFLKELLQRDERILDRIPVQKEFGIDESPLHTSALLGHVDFAREILRRKPQLACMPNSQGSLPLHLAAAKGHVAIVQELLKVNEAISDMCLARDRKGRTPLHVAAAAGSVEVLSELVYANPAAMRAPTLEGDSVFHFCVKRNHFAALKLLVESADAANIINFKDSEDNSVLHLATAKKNIQMLEIILGVDGVDVEAKNEHGFTALDVLAHSPSEEGDSKIVKILKKAGCRRATRVANRSDDEKETVKQMRKNYLVAATLIATVTFSAGLSPPGSVWTEPAAAAPSPSPQNHPEPGTAIFSKDSSFGKFFAGNTTAFFASCIAILLMLTGMEFESKLITFIVSFAIGLALTSMVLAFCDGAALVSLHSKQSAMQVGVGVWIFFLALGFAYPLFQRLKIIYKAWREENQSPGTENNIEGGRNI